MYTYVINKTKLSLIYITNLYNSHVNNKLVSRISNTLDLLETV